LFLKVVKKYSFFAHACQTLVNIVLIYTHPFGVFSCVIQNAMLAFMWPKINFKKNWLVSQAVLGLFVAALVLLLGVKQNDIDFISKPTVYSLLEVFEAFSYGGPRQAHCGVGLWVEAGRLAGPRLLTVFFLVLAALGALLSLRGKPEPAQVLLPREKTVFLLMWLSVPILSAYFFSLVFFPVYLTRYLIICAPAFYILVSCGISGLKSRAYRAMAVAAVVLLNIFALHLLYYPGASGSWKRSAEFVRENIGPRESIVFIPSMQLVPFWYYYKYFEASPLKDVDNAGKKVSGVWRTEFDDGANKIFAVDLKADRLSSAAVFSRIMDGSDGIWLIVSPYWPGFENSAGFADRLGHRYLQDRIYTDDYNGVEVRHYGRIPAQARQPR
jgi:hypothetical protein